MRTGTGRARRIGIGIAVVLLFAALFVWRQRDVSEIGGPDIAPGVVPAETDASSDAPAERPVDLAIDAPVDAPVVATDTTSDPEKAPAGRAPRLDVVRIDPAGSAVIAGSGEGDAEVTLRLDGEEVATVRTDATGNFVSLVDLGPREAPGVLTVETEDASGAVRRAEERIIVAPAARAQDESVDVPATGPSDVAVAAVEKPTGPELTSTVPAQAGRADQGGDATAPRDTAAATARAPAAPRLFRSGPDGIAVIDRSPGEPKGLAVDAITYDAAGSVSLAGTGTSGSDLRIYLDNRPVQNARIGESGTWSSPLPDVNTGRYTLRIDALDDTGTVRGRVETPFERTAPAIAAATRRDGVTAITVQPGFTLWAISEGYFGDGIQYVQIFETNRDQIRDPDLIFPGQVFDLPPIE